MHILKRTCAVIHLDNLIYNLSSFKKLLPDTTKVMCVVKADAYGHGVKEVAKTLSQNGVKWFAVSNLEEAAELREAGIDGEILILGYTPPEEAGTLSKLNIIQACLGIDYAEKLSAAAEGTVRVHIKLDTGMSRIGINCDDASAAADEAEQIYSRKGLSVEGLFTHLCVADSDVSEDIEFTRLQKSRFLAVRDKLIRRGKTVGICHFANSAGGAYGFAEESALARLGIILYGLYPNPALALPFKPKPVMELFSTVSEVKTVKAGAAVGYGRTYTAPRDISVATVTVGYADGYPRALSNKGEVLIAGRRCKIVGRVCMDQIMVDVTGIPVAPGDKVTLIGKSGSEEITADEIASLCGTIGYEIVCGISKRVPRVGDRG